MKSIKIPLIASITVLLVLALASLSLSYSASSDNELLRVSFLDVGQGDAIFIESPGGTQILIDGGRDGMVLRELTKELGFFDRDIDMVVATHFDLDHVGGLIDVLKKYEVGTVVLTKNVNETPATELFYEMVRNEKANIVFAKRGQVFDLGFGPSGTTTFSILFPDHDPTNLETNASSIVAKLVYGENEFMLTGDAPKSIEEYLVSIDGTELESDILKAGHHGSKTSSSEIFLNSVSPNLAVVSAGKDNSYGHPHKEVTDRLGSLGIPYKNTANFGSIRLVSDGKKIWIR